RSVLQTPCSLLTEIAAFVRYRSDGLWAPETNPSKKIGRELKAPHLFRLLAWLMKEMSMGGREALNYPMARAHILWAAQGDHEGTLDLFGGSVAVLLAELERREKEIYWDCCNYPTASA